MNDDQLLRYSRHILLEEIGIEGQQRILDSHALVIGAGGLGSPVALYLGSAGVGQLTVVDHDTVDLTNLQRQIAHSVERVGQAKVDSIRQAVAALNPEVKVQALARRADAALLEQLVAAADVVLDCSDNFGTRQAVNAACVRLRKPLVSGAAIRFDGQLAVYDPRASDSPCYACVFDPRENFETAGTWHSTKSGFRAIRPARSAAQAISTRGRAQWHGPCRRRNSRGCSACATWNSPSLCALARASCRA